LKYRNIYNIAIVISQIHHTLIGKETL